MSTIVSKEIYEMIQQAMDNGEMHKLIVTFEYKEKRIGSIMHIDQLRTTREGSKNLAPGKGYILETNEADIDRITSLKSE